MTVDIKEVDQAERTAQFYEPPPYGILTVWESGSNNPSLRLRSHFSVHTSLRAVKTHITTASTKYDYRTGKKVKNKEVVAKGHYRIYEWHGSWIPVYDIADGSHFKRDHELWKRKAPTEKVAIPEDDIAAAIASITGVGA